MKWKQFIFLLLATGQGICYLLLLSLGNLRENILWAEIWFFTAFIFYWASLSLLNVLNFSAAAVVTQPGVSGQPSDSSSFTIFYIAGIIFCACCFRFILWLSTPSLSDDIYRYVWEGKIFSAGLNPFTHAPTDQGLRALRDTEIYPFINHKELSTIYPPLSLFIFWLCAKLSATVMAMKMSFILFDLLTIGILLLTINVLHISPLCIIIYAWNPLVIMEFSGSGHLDSAGIFFLMFALYLFIKKKYVGSTISLTLSFLTKFLTGMFLPFVLGKRKIVHLLVIGLLVGICYVPFFSAGDMLFNSLLLYSRRWVFNASLYDLLVLLFQSSINARLSAGAIVLSVFLIFLFKFTSWQSLEKRPALIFSTVFILIGCTLVFSPVLYPWYLCWIIPLLVIIPNRAWLVLSGSVFLSYLVWKEYVESGVWQENLIVKLLEYAPFYGILLYDGLKNYRKRSRIFHE